MSTLLSPRMSSVDRIGEIPTISNYGAPWWLAYYGSAVLDNAEEYLRNEYGTKDWIAIHKISDARTDLKSVMEYLDGIAVVAA